MYWTGSNDSATCSSRSSLRRSRCPCADHSRQRAAIRRAHNTPQQPRPIANAKLMANAPGSESAVRPDNATIAPPIPPMVEKPTESARFTWLLTRPSAPSSAYDITTTVVGLNSRPIPNPPIDQAKNVAHSGHPSAITGTLAARPSVKIANPACTVRRGSREGRWATNQDPLVQDNDAPMMTKP